MRSSVAIIFAIVAISFQAAQATMFKGEFTGVIAIERVSEGSKSDRQAIGIRINESRLGFIVLRMKGQQNSFEIDKTLANKVGTLVKCTGYLTGNNTLIQAECVEL